MYFTDTSDDKKWMWVFSVYERSLYDPKKKEYINGALQSALKEAIKEVREGHFITHEEFKREMESWFEERKARN